MSIFFLMILALLGSALITLVPTEMLAAGHDRTDTAAHYACLSAIEQAQCWMTAVQDSAAGQANVPNLIGDTWDQGTTYNYGSFQAAPLAYNPFSVPGGDPNYTKTTVNKAASLLTALVPGSFNNFNGDPMNAIGLKADNNLSLNDFNGMSGNAANWPMLYSTYPLQVGPCTVVTYIIPDTPTMSALGVAGGAMVQPNCYLLTSICFMSGVPVMRCRSVMLQTTLAKYAWDVDQNPNNQPFNIVPNQVLANGPFNSNFSPHFAISSPTFFNTTNKVAINGVVTFAPDQATVNQINLTGGNWDGGLAWVGGNWNGSNQQLDPATQGSGAPLMCSNNTPAYNQVVAGGKANIRSGAAVPLPSDLSALANSAWGSPAYTGLNPYALGNSTFDPQTSYNIQTGAYVATYGGYNTVAGGLAYAPSLDGLQQTYSSTSSTYSIPGYYTTGGAYVAPAGPFPITSQGGLFINRNSTGTVAGGLALSGNMQAVSFDIADQNGNLLTGATQGNPVLRVQLNDSLGMDTTNQIPIPGSSDPTYYSGSAGTFYGAGDTGAYNSGYTGTTYNSGYTGGNGAGYVGGYGSGYTGQYNSGYTGGYGSFYTGGSSPTYSYTYTYVWIPAVSVGTGSYSGQLAGPPTATCTNPGSPGTFHPAFQGTFYGADPGVFHAAFIGTWQAANAGTFYGAGNAQFYNAGLGNPYNSGYSNPYSPGYSYNTGQAYEPKPFQPVDWAEQTTYTPLYIQPTMNMSGSTWANGAGAQGSSPTQFNPVSATTVIMHYDGGPAAGLLITASTNMVVPTGYAVLFKQDRSNENQVDGFIIPPSGASGVANVTNAAGQSTYVPLNGAIFGTGNLDGVRGVNEGRNTIGNDFSTDARISISDNLIQFGTSPGSPPANANNGLGLVSSEVVLRTNDLKFATAGKDLEVYASIIAGNSVNNGGLDVSNPTYDASNSTTTIGNYHIYKVSTTSGNNNGKMNAINTGGYAGQPNPKTNGSGQAGSAGSALPNPTYQIMGGLVERTLDITSYQGRGWAANNNFDQQLAAYPPPFFPTGGGLTPTCFIQESLR